MLVTGVQVIHDMSLVYSQGEALQLLLHLSHCCIQYEHFPRNLSPVNISISIFSPREDTSDTDCQLVVRNEGYVMHSPLQRTEICGERSRI